MGRTPRLKLVFLALFGVILFLVLNLAALIVSMSFFLGKSQRGEPSPV